MKRKKNSTHQPMDVPDDFVIDQVSWHTRTVGNPETSEMVKTRFRTLVNFLQDNKLVVRELLAAGEEPGEEFCFRKSDLTPEGYEVVRKGYDKWLKRYDRTLEALDMKVLERALTVVRSSSP